MKIAVIDYGSGNLRSAARAAERAAKDSGIKGDVFIARSADELENADRIILPGQGAFADCMNGLKSLPGMIETLADLVLKQKRPFLGICVGMQLLAQRGLEHGEHAGLGWIEGSVVPLKSPGLKLPHMGWNTLSLDQAAHPVLKGLSNGDHVYFVHSYKFESPAPGAVIASCVYGERFAAIIARENIVGMQFHPEKSQAAGLKLITNFILWKI